MQNECLKEQERLQFNRVYFEDGCECINSTKTIQRCSVETSDAEAVLFYEQNCTCTRNYVPIGGN